MSSQTLRDEAPTILVLLVLGNLFHCTRADCRHQPGCYPVWLWRGSPRVNNVWGVLALGYLSTPCLGVDSGWDLGPVVRDRCHPPWAGLCHQDLATPLLPVRDLLVTVTLSCHVLASPFPMKRGGGPPSGGWRLRLAPDCLRGAGGRLSGGASATRGALKDSRANFTVGDLAGGSANVAQGKLMPTRSAMRRVQASWHIKFPLPSRSTRAGTVVSSKFWNSPAPCCPATASCGMAVQYGILSKYWVVSSAEAHLEMKTTVALLCRSSSAMRDCRNGPQRGHDSRPKNKPTTAFPQKASSGDVSRICSAYPKVTCFNRVGPRSWAHCVPYLSVSGVDG